MVRNKVVRNIEQDAEILYNRHPRILWALFLICGLLAVLIQSYFALPRNIPMVLSDGLFPIVVVASGLLILRYPKNKNLAIFGSFYLVLTTTTYLTSWIQKPYGTFFFLLSAWAFADWSNYKRFRKSLFSEIVRGNYVLAFGILVSTFIFGVVTEIINLPFMIWEYHLPMPSLSSFGVPALIAAFGWTPWTLAILAIFYPFVLIKPSWLIRFKRFRKFFN